MSVTASDRLSNAAALRALANTRARALAPLIAEVREGGAVTPTEIARELNWRGCRTPQGNLWCATQVQRVLTRLETIR